MGRVPGDYPVPAGYCTIRHYPDPAGYYFKSGWIQRCVTPQCRASKTVTIDKVQHCISRQSRRQSTMRQQWWANPKSNPEPKILNL